MIKYSPVLEQLAYSRDWYADTNYDEPWLCHTGVDRNWNITGKQIWIAGSDTYVWSPGPEDYTYSGIRQEAGTCRLTDDFLWMRNKWGAIKRYENFARFLASFNAPVVWVWIEEWVE